MRCIESLPLPRELRPLDHHGIGSRRAPSEGPENVLDLDGGERRRQRGRHPRLGNARAQLHDRGAHPRLSQVPHEALEGEPAGGSLDEDRADQRRSTDPERGLLVAATNRLSTIVRLIPREKLSDEVKTARQNRFERGTLRWRAQSLGPTPY